MTNATRTSWKTLPPPKERARLNVPEIFSDATAERMLTGHIPEDMDDKWFIYAEDGWLHFHRSWTGAHIFALRLDGSSAGVRVIDAWASRDVEQYTSTDIELDKERLLRLVHRYFGQ
nr:hypothetical protein [Dyella sp. ASV24]